jgi:hypothetical protein
MNKITPKIFNGSLQLVLSETLCCNASHGIQVHVPITVDKTVEFHFVFNTDADLSLQSCTASQKGDVLTISLTNFLSPFGAALTQPFEFTIGEDKFFLQIYGASAGTDCLCLTVSIFREQKNV